MVRKERKRKGERRREGIKQMMRERKNGDRERK